MVFVTCYRSKWTAYFRGVDPNCSADGVTGAAESFRCHYVGIRGILPESLTAALYRDSGSAEQETILDHLIKPVSVKKTFPFTLMQTGK